MFTLCCENAICMLAYNSSCISMRKTVTSHEFPDNALTFHETFSYIHWKSITKIRFYIKSEPKIRVGSKHFSDLLTLFHRGSEGWLLGVAPDWGWFVGVDSEVGVSLVLRVHHTWSTVTNRLTLMTASSAHQAYVTFARFIFPRLKHFACQILYTLHPTASCCQTVTRAMSPHRYVCQIKYWNITIFSV